MINLFTRIIAFILLFLLLPVILFITLTIFFESGKPIFFRQQRVGKNNFNFTLIKFRTMTVNTPDLATNLIKNPDQYITRVGKILRTTSLDELPQLINIIKGDMNFVGPRPALHNQENLIKLRTQKGINSLKPGITGWAQVNGRDNLSSKEKVRFDNYYLKNKSFFLNMKIIFMTIFKIFIFKDVRH